MTSSLQDAKRKVRARYLGKHGIHAVGVREAANAICVYLHQPEGPEQEELLKEIERDLAPIKVIKVIEAPPHVTSVRS